MKTRIKVVAAVAGATATLLLAGAWLSGYNFDYRSGDVAEAFLCAVALVVVMSMFAAGWPGNFEDEK